VPILIAIVGLLLLLALIAVSVPLSILQRYRAGTARRRARAWVATLNVGGLLLSAALLLLSAALASGWVPLALPYTLAGLLVGCVLGLVGLALSRWEAAPGSLHYTPNRWLVFSITMLVAARLIYGFWRGWQAWQSTPAGVSWLDAAGAAGSMGAGALVLGYYLAYWAGVRRQLSRLPKGAGR
jgi:hypothetical protein